MMICDGCNNEIMAGHTIISNGRTQYHIRCQKPDLRTEAEAEMVYRLMRSYYNGLKNGGDRPNITFQYTKNQKQELFDLPRKELMLFLNTQFVVDMEEQI